ncbi:Hypothetical protein CINCED_3A024073 [Cinara cedri]|uniref:Ensconsin-like n=1 Tax=Cinara cedri TaxID=506608 RepID=A0A5E4MZ87_9HEMI|nr:Hypothetical protein CINCED_3A024073 [Cinara cedri]
MAGLLRVPQYRHSGGGSGGGEDCSRTAGPEEGIDNLLLVPESVLDMDGNQLRDDLNGLRFAFQKQYLQADLGPRGNIWISGVTTVNSDNRPSTAPTPPQNSSKGKENAIKDREERLRLVREKHDEERQRKLDELKQQALAVQRYREQKEEERRKRLDEMRSRDFERRQQVEERKRQLFEAEREKREAILKKNQEREARIESKRRNERSSIVFAFGSSTPRMLEPSETGGSYWASRRATSTSNVMMLSSTTPMGPLTRRSSERELNECSGKKRAASAGGLSNRNADGMKSGEMTPVNRPQSSMSQSAYGPAPTQSRSRPVATPRKPRPISIAVTGVTSSDQIAAAAKSPATGERPPLPKVNVTKKSITPKVEAKKFPNDTNKQSTLKEKNKNEKPSESTENAESSEQHHSSADVVSSAASRDDESQDNSIQESVSSDLAECDMTASMLATKQKITTEEEAKAALAERRRLAREQAEKDAELERQRLEAERLAEEERLRCEEEEQRRMEEEQLRLLEEARKSEELRLQLAIEETRKRDLEEKKRKEEELKLKLEKEEADRKAKEEAEKLRQEMEIKLKKEEEDRQLRRKRVEAIMLRTRNQGKGTGNASTKDETESVEPQVAEKIEKSLSDPMTTSLGPTSETEAMLSAERNHSSSSLTMSTPSETLSNGLQLTSPKQNGHTNNTINEIVHHSNGHLTENGNVFDSDVQLNNVTNNLLDLSLEPIPSDTLSTQQIIDIGIGKCIQDNPTDFTAYQENKRSDQQIVNDLLS